jgi:hypothetical protein
MRFRLTATTFGDATADAPVQVQLGDIRIGLEPGPDKFISKIWVDAPVPDFEAWLPTLIVGKGTPHQLTFREPPQYQRLLETLQYIESLGSFWLQIRRIDWGEAASEWIPESSEEKARIQIFSLSRKSEYPRRPVPLIPGRVAELIALQKTKQWLVLPMSFFREGTNDFDAHRYVGAFFSFYFFLEDLFGQAKTKNRDVLKAFKSSAELVAATGKAYQQICAPDMAETRARLDGLIGLVGGDKTPEGLLEFLVKLRGDLHHFSRHSSRPKGHPFNQEEFRPAAFFAMAIILVLMPQLITRS